MPKEADFNIDIAVQAAQNGDKEAFGRLYDHFFDSIYRYVYFRVNAEEVDDLVENIFIKIWVKLDSYEKRDVSFSAWLFRLAHNTIIDHRRTHRSILPIHPEVPDSSERAAPKLTVKKNLMGEALREAVQSLKDPYRQLLTLKFLLGFPNEEIAEVLGVTEGNVRVLQFRALKALKKDLERKGFEAEFL